MNRRTFLRALAAIPLVGSVPALAAYRKTTEATGVVPDSDGRVEIALTQRMGGTVKVDGFDLSHVCCKVELTAEVNEPRRVRLTLMPKSVRVTLDGATVEMIEKNLAASEADGEVLKGLRQIQDMIGQLHTSITAP